MTRTDPLRNFRFRLEINGIQQAGFNEVTGLDISVDPIDYREGNEPTHVRKLPGLTKYGNVTLKWGITDSTELYDWHRAIVDGNIQRKNVAIILIDEAGNDRARFELVEVWPSKYETSGLKAQGNGVVIEMLELVSEGVTRTA